MKQDTKEKMDFWLSQNLESTHPLDERRKFSFVLELYQNDDNVQFEDLYESFCNSHPTMMSNIQENCVKNGISKYRNLKRFVEYLMDEK